MARSAFSTNDLALARSLGGVHCVPGYLILWMTFGRLSPRALGTMSPTLIEHATVRQQIQVVRTLDGEAGAHRRGHRTPVVADLELKHDAGRGAAQVQRSTAVARHPSCVARRSGGRTSACAAPLMLDASTEPWRTGRSATGCAERLGEVARIRGCSTAHANKPDECAPGLPVLRMGNLCRGTIDAVYLQMHVPLGPSTWLPEICLESRRCAHHRANSAELCRQVALSSHAAISRPSLVSLRTSDRIDSYLVLRSTTLAVLTWFFAVSAGCCSSARSI